MRRDVANGDASNANRFVDLEERLTKRTKAERVKADDRGRGEF